MMKIIILQSGFAPKHKQLVIKAGESIKAIKFVPPPHVWNADDIAKLQGEKS